LLTFVEVDGVVDLRAAEFHVSARHGAVLDDGRRVTLLHDRGWGGKINRGEIWPHLDREQIEDEARFVVGPDEAFGDHTQEDMAPDHWAHLAGVLGAQGVEIEAAELRRLPHEVALGERLLAALEAGRDLRS
jgi:hypothetical protein